jgi:hypothetical protein
MNFAGRKSGNKGLPQRQEYCFSAKRNGGGAGNRTPDTADMSRML